MQALDQDEGDRFLLGANKAIGGVNREAGCIGGKVPRGFEGDGSVVIFFLRSVCPGFGSEIGRGGKVG